MIFLSLKWNKPYQPTLWTSLGIIGHNGIMLVMPLPKKKGSQLAFLKYTFVIIGIYNSEHQPYYSRHLAKAESTRLGAFQSGTGRLPGDKPAMATHRCHPVAPSKPRQAAYFCPDINLFPADESLHGMECSSIQARAAVPGELKKTPPKLDFDIACITCFPQTQTICSQRHPSPPSLCAAHMRKPSVWIGKKNKD